LKRNTILKIRNSILLFRYVFLKHGIKISNCNCCHNFVPFLDIVGNCSQYGHDWGFGHLENLDVASKTMIMDCFLKHFTEWWNSFISMLS